MEVNGMRVCCLDMECRRKHNYDEFEFEVGDVCPLCHKPWDECEHAPWDEEVGLKCPECGKANLAPAWSKNIRMPGEKETIQKLKALDKELVEAQSKLELSRR
jgi:hypothetical protein